MEPSIASAEALEAMMPLIIAVYGIVILLVVIAQWKIYTKAGQPGWASIIPIYSIIVYFDIIKKPGWWFIMFFIPILNIIFAVKFVHALSIAFGKGAGFTVGLIFLPIIFYPILAFGDAEYVLNEDNIDTSNFGKTEVDVNMEKA